MTNTVTVDFDSTAMFTETSTGVSVTRESVLELSTALDPLRDRIRQWRSGKPYSFYHLPFRDDIAHIQKTGTDIGHRFAKTVVLGIGGSSLGGETLVRCLGRKFRPVRFFENIDPGTLEELQSVDWESTFLLVISKSGQTAETLAQFLGVLPVLEENLGPDFRDHVLIITENRDGALAKIGEALNVDVMDHPPVGGRFSALSVVGLLPAAIAGVDIARLLEGAKLMAERCAEPDMERNPAFFQGTIQFLHAQAGRRINVFMPYADRLRPLGMWFRQLLAESIGKRDRGGASVGLTPALAMGVTDQHSQLQLYLEGPDDKQFTLLADPNLEKMGARIPDRFAHLPAVEPLAGHTVGELLMAEFRATRETLTRHGRPNRVVRVDTRDPAFLGALMFQIEVEVVVIAELLGVDPFDQPAVEEGKKLAREYLKK